MIKQNQNGSIQVVIVVAIVILLIGGVSYLFRNNFMKSNNLEVRNSHSNSNGNKEGNIKVDPYENWKTYTSNRDGYSIKYPPDWFLAAESINDGLYIRNFDPANSTEGSREGEDLGYPAGAKYIRVLLDKGDTNKGSSSMTTTEWYNSLGQIKLQDGPIVHLPEDVKELKVKGMQAKSAKARFTETNEYIYLLHGTNLYNFILYPYGSSSDDSIKKIVDSFAYL